MNLRTLEYISAVAEFGHFGKAAAFCHVSQPALSEQIKKYETRIGVPIFERGTRHVRITQTGARIVVLVRAALSALEEIDTLAQASRDPLSGSLRIGMIPTIAPYLIPRIAPPLIKKLPNVTIQYCEDITDRLVDSLERGELDMLVVSTLPGTGSCEHIPLYRERFLLAINRTHPLAGKKTVRITDIPTDELLLLNDGHCMRDQSMEVAGLVSGKRSPALWATNIETLVNMAAAKQGVTLVPELAALSTSISHRDILHKPFSDRRAAREVQLAYSPGFQKHGQLTVMKTIIGQSLKTTPIVPLL